MSKPKFDSFDKISGQKNFQLCFELFRIFSKVVDKSPKCSRFNSGHNFKFGVESLLNIYLGL